MSQPEPRLVALDPGIPAQSLQTASRETIAAYQMQRLRVGLERVLAGNPFYGRKLAGLDPHALLRLEDLERLSFTEKSELVADQQDHPPYGTNLTFPLRDYVRLHQTSGTSGQPLRILDTAASWDWWADCWTTIYHAAGVTADDVIFLAFSFGPFIGFWSAYEGGKRVGALVVPGGGQSSTQRLQAMLATSATVLVCTPTYALHLAEVAREEGIAIQDSAVRVTIHAGEPGASIPTTRRRIEEAWGARTYDHIGMTEMGAYAFTCRHQENVHVNEAEFIAEVLDPATGRPVAEGAQGELVLTNLGRWGTPAIRYRTRDLVVRGPAHCACGRSFMTLPGGVLGRADDMLTVRGVNVYPSGIEAAVRSVPEVQEFRITVFKDGEMDEIAVEAECPAEAVPRVEEALRRSLSLRVPVQAVPSGTLPRFELKARRVVDKRPH
ncbi:MAG TPA: AMP-binding protein [Ktedonobacterales bacterium]|nr:AMP-binding protein [Ktedonobacterales bacterium]